MANDWAVLTKTKWTEFLKNVKLPISAKIYTSNKLDKFSKKTLKTKKDLESFREEALKDASASPFKIFSYSIIMKDGKEFHFSENGELLIHTSSVPKD
jgi:hypothetical protein